MAGDPISALIGGIFDMGVSGMNAGFTSAAARQSYKYSLRLQKQAQEWQERMANTAHQRQVADMRAAGLNPIMSATGGTGAAVPSGSSATINVDPIKVTNPLDSALKAMKADKELSNIDAQTKAADSQAKKNDADAALADARRQQVLQETKVDKAKGSIADSVGDYLSTWKGITGRIGDMISNGMFAPKGAKFGPNGQRLVLPSKRNLKNYFLKDNRNFMVDYWKTIHSVTSPSANQVFRDRPALLRVVKGQIKD